MKRQIIWWQLLAVLTALIVFFVFLFYVDNKYQTPPPYGRSGVLALQEETLARNTPVYLIDGWLLTDARVTDKPTYIGEFSNLQRGNPLVMPHGQARYQLTLRYEGAPQVVSIDFPQLSSWYSISLDGTCLTQGSGNGQITFLLTEGDHVLSVNTFSRQGYYSGMYFPPALGTEQTLSRVRNVQEFAYALAFLLPLALAAFTLFLWRTGGQISRFFALLCCCYALYMFRFFVYLFSLSVVPYWFLFQSLALYCLCFCVVRLTALISGTINSRAWWRMQWILLALPAVLLLLCLLMPAVSWAVFIHSGLTDIYYMFTFACTVFFAVKSIGKEEWENKYTLAGCLIFVAGLVLNLLSSNRFEPIYFYWQFEWCGLFLVILFGVMMVSRSRRILRENDALTNHLEEQVQKRTQEVTQLLEERKAFFSDMAHDLKAPVFATQSFIEAIRRSGVGVDLELQGYLDQAEAKQREMAKRLQGLSTINALDRIEEEQTRISVREMLAELYAIYHEEAAVRSVYFRVQLPEQDAFLTAQPAKLNILFENLIYNALRVTPPNGSITVAARTEEERICVTVEDTGCGIPEEELPLIFRRFYVGTNNKDSGTGLGLYIVQSIVTELGGTIDVRSSMGKGTVFTMFFPQNH